MQRPLQSSVVIGIGMAHDPAGKISERDNQFAVACAVQNMHLTCTNSNCGQLATGGVVTGVGMRNFLGLGEHDPITGLFFIGYPAIGGQKATESRWTNW